MWKKINILRQKYLDLRLNEVIDYEKFAMISIVYNSTKIEGCSLSENDTRVLLENDITAKGKPLSDHLMVKDHFAAFQFVQQEAKKKRKLSIPLIKEVAGLVMKNTGGIVNTMSGSINTASGDIRLAQVFVDKKYFPDFKKIESLLLRLFEQINKKIDEVKGEDILKLSADFHYNLVNIHPFGDVNGRSLRLMMNYLQIYLNEPLIKFLPKIRPSTLTH